MAWRGLTPAQGVSAWYLLIDAFLLSLLPSQPSNIKTDFSIEPTQVEEEVLGLGVPVEDHDREAEEPLPGVIQ